MMSNNDQQQAAAVEAAAAGKGGLSQLELDELVASSDTGFDLQWAALVFSLP